MYFVLLISDNTHETGSEIFVTGNDFYMGRFMCFNAKWHPRNTDTVSYHLKPFLCFVGQLMLCVCCRVCCVAYRCDFEAARPQIHGTSRNCGAGVLHFDAKLLFHQRTLSALQWPHRQKGTYVRQRSAARMRMMCGDADDVRGCGWCAGMWMMCGDVDDVRGCGWLPDNCLEFGSKIVQFDR